MNILHLLNSNGFGGAEKIALNIIEVTKERANSLYVSRDGSIRKKLEKNELNYILLDKITIKKIRNIINTYNIDIIHAHDFNAGLIASSFYKEVKIISHIHQSPKWLNNKMSIKYIAYNIISNKFSKIILTSNEIKQTKLFKEYKNTIILPNYVETTQRNSFNQKKIYDFIYVGRFESEKSPDKFIQIIELLQNKYPNVSAAMIGSGSMLKESKKEVEEKELNITFTGFIENPEKYISESKFLINTSKKEGFGISMIEAMQLGTPVITFKNGGVSEEITNYFDGILIENVDEVFNIYDNYILSNEKYQDLSKNSKKLGDKYNDKEKWVESLFLIYFE